MKKIAVTLMLAISFLSLIPTITKAESGKNATDKVEMTAENKLKEQKIMSRLEEIKALDKTNMTHAEKKELRKEVKTLKTNLAQLSGGVYLSVGAIIIIVLLLILLL